MYTIWGRPNCTFCEQAKVLLNRHMLDYKYIELTDDNADEFKLRFPATKQVPQIMRDSYWIGGLEDLKRYIDR